MQDAHPDSSPRNRRGMKVALLGAGIAAGAIGATAAVANAQSSTPATAITTAAPGGTGAAPAPRRDGSAPVRKDEKSLPTGTTATLKAAALKAVPGATVYRIETDAGDGVYEAHMTKSDGTPVTVKFDKNLKVTKVEQGMGGGDPAPAGQPPAEH